MPRRLNELSAAKTKLADGEAEKQRLAREVEEQAGKLQWLTKINAQLENSAAQVELYRKQVCVCAGSTES